MVWKNVSVNVVNFKGVDYYAIDAKVFGKIAASSERREDVRVEVKKQGTAVMEDGRQFLISLLNVSDSGVSFIGNASRVTIGDVVKINFVDRAHSSYFSLDITVRIVRAEAEADGILYAGTIIERDNKLLAYLCFKGMDFKNYGR